MIGHIFALRFRISTQLYGVIGAAVALTVAASLVGWFSFNRVGDVQSRVNEGSVPDLVQAFGIAQLSNTLVTAAPRLTTASNSDDLEVAAELITESHVALEQEIDSLASRGTEEERVQMIRDYANSVVLNIDLLTESMSELFVVAERRGGSEGGPQYRKHKAGRHGSAGGGQPVFLYDDRLQEPGRTPGHA